MLPNEVFALACRAYYEEQGLIVDKTNGEFAHCPYPEGMGDTGYYLLHGHHQHQGLLQSKDVGKCCFFVGHAKKWLQECDYFPDSYFELWDIYEKYSSEHSKKANEKLHSEKDEEGKSVAAKSVHITKDDFGRSVNALNASRAAHAEKDELGRSVLGVKNAERMNRVLHKEKDESGKSLHNRKVNKKVHSKKNDEGKSVVAVKAGRSSSSQVWESLIDGFRSNAGNVSKHNKVRGWDPKARVRIS
jgi:hypothetical protein